MGVIHRAAVLDDDEIAHASALGLDILPTDRPLFSLPCPRLEGTMCGVYRDRPRVCGRYKCQMLQNVEAGKTPVSEAIEKVSEAKRLLGELQSILPNGMSCQQARRLAQGAPSDGFVDVRLRATALDLFIDKFFRNSRDRKSFELSSVEFEQEPRG